MDRTVCSTTAEQSASSTVTAEERSLISEVAGLGQAETRAIQALIVAVRDGTDRIAAMEPHIGRQRAERLDRMSREASR